MFKHLKLRAKFLLGFLIIIFLTGVAAIYSITTVQQANRNFRDFDEYTLSKTDTFVDFKDFLNMAIISAYEDSFDTEAEFQTRELLNEAEFSLGKYLEFLGHANGADSFINHRLQVAFSEVEDEIEQLLELHNQGADQEVVLEQMKQLRIAKTRAMNSVHGEVDKLLEQEREYERRANKQFLARATKVTVGISVIIMLLIVLVSLYLSRSLAGRILKARQLALDIASGQLGKKVVVDSKDEIGDLALALNIMTDRLKDFYENIEGMAQERTKELEEAKKDLEKKVKERTKKLEKK